MIDVRLTGQLRTRDQLRLIALSPLEKRRILLRIGRGVARRLRTAIRRQVRNAPPDTFGSEEEKREKARTFAKLVRVRATPSQVVVFDGGLPGSRPRQADSATRRQAQRMRELGFQLSVAYITRNFSQGLAGLIIRELETQKRGRRRRRNRGSIVLLAWRKEEEKILAAVNVEEIVRRELAA